LGANPGELPVERADRGAMIQRGSAPPGSDIKRMKLYRQVERVFNELAALGIGVDDRIEVDQLADFDQYHYFGNEAVDEAVRRLRLTCDMDVLDVGGGIGGPARRLSYRVGCRVTALELQPDLNEIAVGLTRRCGLGDRIEHVCGDILAGIVARGRYDALVSWLTFLHIPGRAALYRRCFESLKPGAGMYVEDFFVRSPLTATERRSLANDIFCDYVPTLADYQNELVRAGFEALEFVDVTDSWRLFVVERLESFRARRERHLALHGAEIVNGLDDFYAAVAALFRGGNLGGIRLVAWTPSVPT
jgi:cyclopropane fatty-acyl-phospholipid synthase-like methyltransferase